MAMSNKLKTAFEYEMTLARTLFFQEEYAQCFHHLERAHILGQRHCVPHVINHFWMPKVGLKQRNANAVLGQVIRIVGSVGSLFGKVPIGNTGGVNVGILEQMPIPPDLLEYFE